MPELVDIVIKILDCMLWGDMFVKSCEI
jgi:hypothetical protein